MLVYECYGNFNESHYGPGYNCRDQANMPFLHCYGYSIAAVWAVGGEVGNCTLSCTEIVVEIVKAK